MNNNKNIQLWISKKGKSSSKNILFYVMFIILLVYSVSYLVPFAWGIVTSLKTDYDLMFNPFGLPEQWKFDNYAKIWEGVSVPVRKPDGVYNIDAIGMTVYSVLYVVGCTFFNIMFPIFTSYAASKFGKYSFCRFLYTLAIIIMIIPIVGSLPSELSLVRAMGMYDNLVFMWFMKGSGFGMNFMMLYAAFKSIPNDYGDAARIDGASEFGVLFKIMLPLVSGTIMAISILSIISYWNDYTTSIVYLPSYPTLAYGLFALRDSFDPIGSQTTIRIAGCLLLTLPIFIIFLIFNKFFLQNLAIGGLKG